MQLRLVGCRCLLFASKSLRAERMLQKGSLLKSFSGGFENLQLPIFQGPKTKT